MIKLTDELANKKENMIDSLQVWFDRELQYFENEDLIEFLVNQFGEYLDNAIDLDELEQMYNDHIG